MTILLQWLVEHAWVFYAVCAVGILIYLLRALAAQRERNLAMFTLERETATSRVIQSWAMVFVFVVIGALIFVSTAFLLPTLPIYGAGTPPPTPTLAAGVEPSTPNVALTPSPTIGLVVPTLTIPATDTPLPGSTETEPTDVPTPLPTDTPQPGIVGEVRVRFSGSGELIGFNVPSTEFTTAQSLPLTLYWRGGEGASTANYLVFTHLYAQDGRLIAQHDGPPAGGTRPTSTWGAGETIVDPHPMAFADSGYTGPATIAVGLYDPALGRVLTETGDDSVVLPISISIVPQ
jgi:hypothetical protein